MGSSVTFLDVTDLTLAASVINPGQDFEATATITGDPLDAMWGAIKDPALGLSLKVTFFAEGFAGAPEQNLGDPISVPLVLADDVYTVTNDPYDPDLEPGVYRINCLVQVEHPFDHVAAFFSGDVLGSVRAELP